MYRGFSVVGVEPDEMGVGPAYAVPALLERTGVALDDVDLFEINEAFSVVSLAVAKELGLSLDKVNPRGGAVALGHPIGASGNRILVTLLYTLIDNNKRYGTAGICLGGGEAVALTIERL